MSENWRGNVCPKCGEADQIDVAATVWVRLTNDGSDADESMSGDHEYDDDSNAECAACGYKAKLASFNGKKLKTYTVTMTENFIHSRTATAIVEATDLDQAVSFAKISAHSGQLEWIDHEDVDSGPTDFEVSAPEEPTHTWRED